MSKRLSDYGRKGINLTRTAMEYPALNGEVVTQRHADYCADNGHAVHIADGVISPVCPRCGSHKDERVQKMTDSEIKSAIAYIESDYIPWDEYYALVAERKFRADFNARMENHRYRADQLSAAIAGLVRAMSQGQHWSH